MGASKLEPSGVLLLRMWKAFEESWQRQFPGSALPSMRMMSKRLLADPQALARWTNHKAHMGAHPGWRIPLRRIPEVTRVLEVDEDARNDLMLARLSELSATQEGVDALVVLHWLEPLLSELSRRHELDRQELQVVQALGQAREQVPGWTSSTSGTQVSPTLVRALTGWLQTAQNEYLEELRAERDEDIQAQASARQRFLARAADSTSRSSRVNHAKPPSTQDTEALVRSVRKSLRGALHNND